MLKNLKVITIFIFFCVGILCSKPTFANVEYESWLDSITEDNKIFSEVLPIRGWFFHVNEKIQKIELYIDGKYISTIKYGEKREDVFKAYPQYEQSLHSGYETYYKLDSISFGSHTYSIKVTTESNKEIEIATGQFIKQDIYNYSIDYPISKEIKLKNDDIEIRGWIFNSTGIEGIYIYLDDKLLGKAEYGLQREDVLEVYPDYENAEFSGFRFLHASENIDPGEHSINIKAKSEDGSLEIISSVELTKQKDYTILTLSAIVILFYVMVFIFIKKKPIQMPQIHYKWLQLLVSRIDVIWFLISLSIKVIAFKMVTNIKIDNFTILTNIAVVFIIAIGLSFISKNKLRFSLLFSLNLIITTIIYADIVYLRYFNDVTSIIVLSYVSQVSQLGGSIKELLEVQDIYLFFDLIIVICFFLLKRKPIKLNKTYKLFALIGIFIALVPVAITVNNIYSDEGNVFSQTFSNKEVVKELGVLNYHIFDSVKNLKTLKKSTLSAQEEQRINKWFDNHEVYDSNAPLFGIAKNKNLILIQEESLQSFVIGLTIDGQEITPNINQLLKESIYYENFYDQTYNGRTSDGELTALTSLYPLREGTVNFRYPDTQVDTLPKVLNKNGYETFSAHAFKGAFWNRRVMHNNYGFNQSMFYRDFTQTEIIGWGLSDHHFFNQSVEEIKQLETPFFSYLISLSTHHPYDFIPDKYKKLELGDLDNSLIGDYLHSVHYADYSIGVLIEDLKNNGVYENSVIAIYGDHDAGIKADEIRSLTSTNLFSDKLYDKIPFVIHIPNSKGIVNKEISGQLDITPTLLHLLGIEATNLSFMGHNLFMDNENKLVGFREGKFITDQLIYDNSCIRTIDETEVNTGECESLIEQMKEEFIISDLLIKTDFRNH